MLKYNEDNIKELLLRFTEGQTTEAEEEVLKDYFTHSKHIPEEWEAYKATLERCGLSTLLDIYQTVYDRYVAAK